MEKESNNPIFTTEAPHSKMPSTKSNVSSKEKSSVRAFHNCLEYELQKEEADFLENHKALNERIKEKKTQVHKIKNEILSLKNEMRRIPKVKDKLIKQIEETEELIEATKDNKVHPILRKTLRKEKTQERKKQSKENEVKREQLEKEKEDLMKAIDMEKDAARTVKEEINILKYQREFLAEELEKSEAIIENERKKLDAMRREFGNEIGTLEECLAKYKAKLFLLDYVECDY